MTPTPLDTGRLCCPFCGGWFRATMEGAKTRLEHSREPLCHEFNCLDVTEFLTKVRIGVKQPIKAAWTN